MLGYHGCEKELGMSAIQGNTDLLASEGKYDWLGTGIYFWEGDPRRANEWAEQKRAFGKYKEPFVIGAVIDLRNCLDLTVREDLELVRKAYLVFRKKHEDGGLPLPQNTSAPRDGSPDKVLRYLDCAVIDYLHSLIREQGEPPYDTVRALFAEGEFLYEGGGFREKNHSQIAVRNHDCIRGFFIPR